jgi:hypothetical protein
VTVTAIVRENIARESRLHTDESRLYTGSDEHFEAHETVKHSGSEYVRYEDGRAIHSNTVEGYFSIFKRGMKGIYQHCKEKHLHRYLAEYDFRYNHRTKLGFNDRDRRHRSREGCGWQAIDLPSASLRRTTNPPPSASSAGVRRTVPFLGQR